MVSRLAAAICVFCFVATAGAAEPKREVLYEITGDFDHDGTPDRAVYILVGPGNSDTSDLAKERYGLGDDERVDLAIYMGAGNALLDISKPPTFQKEDFADKSRNLNWVLPPEISKAGSLLIHVAQGWGSSHEEDETLILRIKDGAANIIGYDFTWALRDGAGGCSIDLQNGNATRDDGAQKKRFKVNAMPIALKDWTQPGWENICKAQ